MKCSGRCSLAHSTSKCSTVAALQLQNWPNALKEQYPVTAHAPNFDFWTGCRKIKRCEESRRTLKNPFASRLAEFSTTLKLLRITDQRCNVPVEFRFGRSRDFFGVTFIAVGRRTKDEKSFDADWRLNFFASFHTSSDNCVRNTQKWNSNNKDGNKETIEALMWLFWGDLVKLASWGRLFCNDALVNFYSLRPTKSNKQVLHV